MRRLKGMCAAGVILAVTLPALNPPVLAVMAATLAAGAWHFRHVPARRRLVRHLAECVDALSGTGTAERKESHRERRVLAGSSAFYGALSAVVCVWRGGTAVTRSARRASATPPRFLDGEPSRRERLERIIDAKLPGTWGGSGRPAGTV